MGGEDYAVDIARDARGQFFELRIPRHLNDVLEATVPQAEARERHLLLMVRKTGSQPALDRFLCGHDEREWFVAAVPGGASSVRQAMDILQPEEVRDSVKRNRVSPRKRYRRRNQAFRRQGEWFFIPEASFEVDETLVLRNEPIRRGRGKAHRVEQLYRTGGETVYVSQQHPNGLTEQEHRTLLRENPAAARWHWRVMRRNPGVYARGAVRHGDHQTITLPFRHRVLMNTENESRSMTNVAFLD